MTDREWIYLASSNLQGCRYDADTKDLYIEFKNGSQYVYRGVPKEVYEDFISASSPGSFFHDEIKNIYSYRRA